MHSSVGKRNTFLYLYSFAVSALALSFIFICPPADSLENGLARTPPMGWLSWTRFLCNIDCKSNPKGCISENLFKEMANIIAHEGYRDAGYVHVNIDDCWAKRERHPTTQQLVPDPDRFPSGIPKLAQHMHNQGLKLGIYSNYGRKTCMGFAGTELEDMERDAQTFADWGADYLKFDGCFRKPTDFHIAYPKMSKALAGTGRKFVYSCSWPYYVRIIARQEPDYHLITEHCHLWRNFDDIEMKWSSVKRIIQFYDTNQDELGKYHGPGHWNDPDMLVIGNPGLTVDQARTQMALWCLWSAPLLMSNDLRDINEPFRQILLNKKLIAVDQDPLGRMGKRVLTRNKIGYYLKPMTPTIMSTDGQTIAHYSYAIVVFNEDASAMKDSEFSLKKLGIKSSTRFSVGDDDQLRYKFENLFTGDTLNGTLVHQEFVLRARVPPTGVIMWKATVILPESASAMHNPFQMLLNAYHPFTLFLFCCAFLIICKFRRRLLPRRFLSIVSTSVFH